MTTYLLTCECGAGIPVTTGGAGGVAICPRCGRDARVPKLRDLCRLPRREADATSAAAAWRPAHAVVLLGSVVAGIALAVRAWFGVDGSVGPDVAAIRAALADADIVAVHRVWTEALARAGVRRPPSEEEQRLQRRSRFNAGLRRVLEIVAVGGAVTAVAAAGVLARTSSAPREPGRAPAGEPP